MLAADLTRVTWHSLWTVEGLVALGTLVLAVCTAGLAAFTAAMAKRTAILAEFTEKDVALARTAIEADVRPVLIAVSRGEFVLPAGNYETRVPGTGAVRAHPDRAVVYVQDVDGLLFVSVPGRNEGAGIAFVRSVALDWQGAELGGESTSEQVPPQAFTRASFGLPAPSLHTVNDTGSLSVKITYADLAGNIWASKFTLEPAPEIGQHDWKVAAFDISHEGRTATITAD